jgi:type VI secretion system protein ImpI
MGLTLRLENETSLPDGGPLSVSVQGKRGLDIGRDTHLDWTLPDPSRHVSSKHCEIRYKDGGYWLHDVSTNGTFLYGESGRLKGPHRLRNGDRLVIGQYIIAVVIDGEEVAPTPVYEQQHSSYEEIWNPVGDSAPPVSRSDVQAPREAPRPVQSGDFLDWAADVPNPSAGAIPRIAAHFDVDLPRAAPAFDAPAPARAAPPAAPPPPAPELDWAYGAPKPAPPVEEPPPVPSPRRPVWVSNEPDGPWMAAQGETAAPPPAVPAPNAGEAAMPPPPMPQAAPIPQAAAVMAAPMPPAAPAGAPGGRIDGEFVRRVARGAGIPEDFLARQTPEQLAELLGLLMRLVVDNVRQLLNARLEAKRMTRSANQTMIQALDNNPLKFAPTTEEALRIMFGPPTSSYLDARRTLEQSFDDLKTHQIKTYAAMQQALQMLVADFDPQTIEDETEVDRGIAAVVGSRKARLWDAYVARWQVKTRRNEGGLADVFMQYFAECYERGRK